MRRNKPAALRYAVAMMPFGVMPGWMQAMTLTCLGVIVLFFVIIIDDMVRDYIKEREKKAEDMRRREEDAAYRR